MNTDIDLRGSLVFRIDTYHKIVYRDDGLFEAWSVEDGEETTAFVIRETLYDLIRKSVGLPTIAEERKADNE